MNVIIESVINVICINRQNDQTRKLKMPESSGSEDEYYPTNSNYSIELDIQLRKNFETFAGKSVKQLESKRMETENQRHAPKIRDQIKFTKTYLMQKSKRSVEPRKEITLIGIDSDFVNNEDVKRNSSKPLSFNSNYTLKEIDNTITSENENNSHNSYHLWKPFGGETFDLNELEDNELSESFSIDSNYPRRDIKPHDQNSFLYRTDKINETLMSSNHQNKFANSMDSYTHVSIHSTASSNSTINCVRTTRALTVTTNSTDNYQPTSEFCLAILIIKVYIIYSETSTFVNFQTGNNLIR